MKTIFEDKVVESYEINKSKFIVTLFFIRDKEHAKNLIKNHNKKFSDATHNCYAYILDDDKYYFSDDGEPSGTAGKPIYNSLANNGLNNTMAIVTRYYGGIMLGAGGLVRAYGGSTSKTLQSAKTAMLIKAKEVEVMFTHKQIKEIERIISNYEVLHKDYDLFIKYNVAIEHDDVIENLKRVASNVKVLKDEIIIKK